MPTFVRMTNFMKSQEGVVHRPFDNRSGVDNHAAEQGIFLQKKCYYFWNSRVPKKIFLMRIVQIILELVS